MRLSEKSFCGIWLFVCASILLNCGKKSKGPAENGQAPAGQANDIPATVQDALNLLSPERLAALTKWQSQLTKACDAAAIFDGKSAGSGQESLDLRVLMERTQKSLFVTLGSGLWAIFGDYEAPGGIQETKFSHEQDLNGAREALESSTVRSGATCEVFVSGKRVYATRLASKIIISATQTEQSQAPASKDVFAAGTVLKTQQGFSLAKGEGFDAAVRIALRPDGVVLASLATLLGLSEPDGAKWFSLGRPEALTVSHSFPEQAGIVPFGVSDLYLMGPTDAVSAMALPNADGRVLKTAVLPPLWNFSEGVLNTADSAVFWNFQTKVTVTAQANVQNAFSYKATDLKRSEPKERSNALFADCFMARHKALKALAMGLSPFEPAYSGTIAPCLAAQETPARALFASDVAREVVLGHFDSFVPYKTSLNEYQGWDSIFGQFVEIVLETSDRTADAPSLVVTLNPNRNRPIVVLLQDSLAGLNAALAKNQSMTNALTDRLKNGDDTLKSSLQRVSRSWVLQGKSQQAVSWDKLLAAIANVSDTLPLATDQLLNYLANDAQDSNGLLDYALGISAETKQSLAVISELAKKWSLSAWVSKSVGRLIVDKTPASAVQSWQLTLQDADSFFAADKGSVSPAHERLFADAVTELGTLALEEVWQESDFAALNPFARLAEQRMICKQWTGTTLLLECVGFKQFSRTQGKLLAPEFAGRYVKAVDTFAKLSEAASAPEFSSLRFELEDFFDPIWSACDNAAFEKKLEELAQTGPAYLKSEFPERFKIKRQLDGILEDCSAR